MTWSVGVWCNISNPPSSLPCQEQSAGCGGKSGKFAAAQRSGQQGGPAASHDPRQQERPGGPESHQQGGGRGLHPERGGLRHLHGDVGQEQHQH